MSSIGDEDADANVPAEPAHQSSGSEYEDEDQRHTHDDEYESEREGRFHGPDSSWRFYTKEERAIAASLDQAENNNLSIHLYNTHAWKQRLRGEDRTENFPSWQSKRRWIQPDESGKIPFLPPTTWTTWPMKPEDVPRSREQWGIPLPAPEDEAETLTKKEPWRPSLYLQGEIEAAFQRHAKESFREREQAGISKRDGLRSHSLSEIPEIPINSKTESTRSSLETDNSDDEEGDRRPQRRIKLESKSEREDGIESFKEFKDRHDEYSASFLLDDDTASSMLQPTVRHLASKLDELLIGLHKSRLGHRQDRSRSRGRSEDLSFRPKSRERARSSAGVPSKRKRTESDLNLPDADFQSTFGSGESDSDFDVRPSRAASRGKNKRALGPRDWSEVLGVAALVGWDQDILDRAARRCAATFGESMTMRIMPETIFGNSRDEVVEYIPQYIPRMVPPANSASGDESGSEMEVDEQSGFACPKNDCARHNDPYDTRWRLREHLKKKHKMSKDVIVRLVPPIQAASPKPKAAISDDDSSEQEDEHAQDEALSMVDVVDVLGPQGVRLDGFLQPITIRLPRSKDKQPRRGSSSRRR